VILRREDGETITAHERREVVLLADRPEISITWSRYAGGERGPDLHVHREHTDAFYVLEGEVTFALGPAADPIGLPAGGFLAVPPNVVHAFANEGSAEASWLNFHAPDKGFAAYLRGARDGGDAGFDSFDPPADGGLPADLAIVTGPGAGERLASGDGVVLLKAVLPELCVAEWTRGDPDLPDHGGLHYMLDGHERVLDVHRADIVITVDHRWTGALGGRTLELLDPAKDGA